MAIPYRDEVVPARQLRTLDQLVVELYEIILEILARLTLTSSPVLQNQTIRLNSEMPNVLPPLPDLLASVTAMSNNNNNSNTSSNNDNRSNNNQRRRQSSQPVRRCRCRRSNLQAPCQEREETEAAEKKETNLLSLLLPRSLTRNPVVTAVIFLIGWSMLSRLR